MRSVLIAHAALLLCAGEAAAQIERLDIPPSRGDRRAPPPEARPRRTEALFIAPSGEPFRGPIDGPWPVAKWFARADADHDGKLTLKEFTDDSLTFFDQLDVNKDGVVDGFEAQAYERTIVPEIAPGSDFGVRARPQPKRGFFGGRKPAVIPAEGAAVYGLLNEPQPVAGADADLDRKITRVEATGAAARRFRRLDTDNDGALTLSSLPVTPAQAEARQEAEQRAGDRRRGRD